MKVLVAGGAGYIGSHMVKLLSQRNCQVTTLDDLSSSHRDAVSGGRLVKGNCGDRALLDGLLSEDFDAVMHFASFVQVGESVSHPSKYYANNLTPTLTLLDAMQAHGIRRFIFSSTASTFGEPQYTPIYWRRVRAMHSTSAMVTGTQFKRSLTPLSGSAAFECRW